jgi:flagellar biosynthesis/type III secretory pathway protein FliH
MAKLSPEELQKARLAKKVEREAAEAKRLQDEIEATARKRKEEIAMAAQRELERDNAEKQKARYDQLISATEALYVEMDKLTRKAPGMTISKLSLDGVNKVIRSVKELVTQDKDDFMDEIVEFIPAGDMPEYRDVTLVLSQVKAGLARFKEKRYARWRNLLGVF